MYTSSPTFAQKAPRFYAQRLALRYSFLAAQLLSLTLLAILSINMGTAPRLVITWWSVTFPFILGQDLVAPDSLLTTLYHWLRKQMNLKPRYRQGYAQDKQVFSLYPPPLLFAYRHPLRWLLPFCVLLSLWIMAPYQSYFVTTGDLAQKIFVILLFYVFGFIPYGLVMIDRMNYATRANKNIMWLLLGIFGCVSGLFSFRSLTDDWFSIMTTLFFAIMHTSLFVSQRLWVGETELNAVIREISANFLAFHQAQEKLKNVPKIIRAKLQHDRVFILEPSADHQNLSITAEDGNYQSIQGKTVPIANSLTGRAFQEQETAVWNEVDKCPYYYPLTETNDTQSEIAVPIKHQDVVFGILDVQSNRGRIYSPGDVKTLELIAAMVGAALAVQKRDTLFGEAVDLWEQLVAASSWSFASEEEVFNLFADFVHQRLGVDLVTYFPLSLTGRPVSLPYRQGDFYHREQLDATPHGPDSSLMQLISQWQPYYEPTINADSLISQPPLSSMSNFVQREAIQSTCFIPIGTRRERLGALFLNFRQPRTFDAVFQFTIISLAQSLSEVTAQVRNRHIFLKSFGRPELGLHGLMGRYGLKSGISQNANLLWQKCQGSCCSSLQECVFGQTFSQMEAFLRELSLVDSAMPPNFWQESLKEHLAHYRNDRPKDNNGRRAKLRMQIDPQIEQENAWTKLVLYRLITEAATNAITHADAKAIAVEVQRAKYSIEISVTNDGLPLRDNAYEHRSRHGIFALLQELQEKLGAQAEIMPQANGQGAIVRVSLPTLPL